MAAEAQRPTPSFAPDGRQGMLDGVQSECFVDEDQEPDPELNRITNAVIGAAIEVHRLLGPGQLESAYEEAMAIEMTLIQIQFQRQMDLHLHYKGHLVGSGKLDFLIEGCVVLELKCVQNLTGIHSAQVISYLAITGHKLGLIINFNVAALRQGIKRIARTRTLSQ